MKKMWMVRAGKGAVYIDRFIGESIVGLGWEDAESALGYKRMGDYYRYLLTVYPDWKKRKVSISAGQIYRFYHEIKIGDLVLSYVPQERQYLVGVISSDAKKVPSDNTITHVRSVSWQGRVDRDRLSVSARNTLGAISTLFLIDESVASEISDVLAGRETQVEQPEEEVETNEAESQDDIYEDLQARSMSFLQDRIAHLDWEEMQKLVAGLLRAMGYKTLISPAGPDRGKDVLASPDGFGFEDPRIVVEVKHRKGTMGAPEIRSFLGGRHANDKGLYVSTGGFTREARYEAERANIRVALMDLEEFSSALISNYEKLDLDIQQMLPMRKLYWPI